MDVFEENRNKSCNVIDAVNLWIENAVLLSSKPEDCKDNKFEVNDELFVEMYIYGVVSQALSLISLSRKFQSHELYTGCLLYTSLWKKWPSVPAGPRVLLTGC